MSLEVDPLLLNKVTLQSSPHSARKQNESVYQMLNKLDSTIQVQRLTASFSADVFLKSLPAILVVKIADWFGDGWNKDFEMLQIGNHFGDGWHK